MPDSEIGSPAPMSDPAAGVPRLELDQLLDQLIERAQDVRAAQDRLRGLLRANRSIIGDLTLPVVLRRIVTAAKDLVGARYAALGVISPTGGLEQFIHAGMDEATAQRIGHLPEGKGLLGALIDDPHPIRLRALSQDSRSAGFPDGHPPMEAFLGVPIRVRNAVFGNLYLTDPVSGEFSAQDQELVVALAANAGFAIENARLYEQGQRRQQWLEAATDITQQLLASEGEEPLRVIARRTQQMADADAVTVVLPAAASGKFMVEVATGVGADELTAMSYPQAGTLSAHVLETGEPALVEDMSDQQRLAVHMSEVLEVGALMALPLIGARGRRGVLLVARLRGRPRFTDAELGMAMTFANHAAIALELADARADQQRMVLLEDRDRIARDLHDHVIQRLFAAGLTVESIASRLPAGQQSERLAGVVTDIDETIRQIRTSIFQLRGSLIASPAGLRSRLLQVVGTAADTLGFQPQVTFTGPVDLATDEDQLEHAEAVLREALSNVARHAHAGQVEVAVATVDGQLSIEVCDNGDGMTESTRRSGLDNLRQRAEQLGGVFDITSPWPSSQHQHGGTRLQWTIPLR
ncbi:MAG TPA: GAF domain-containing protein [Jatrophihabitans sp.]|nr:GAF domain-containing protein [Jatrophihabitans sp.]